jgi:hypothetical protein
LEMKSGDYATRLFIKYPTETEGVFEYRSIGGEEWRLRDRATRIDEAIIYKYPTEGEGGKESIWILEMKSGDYATGLRESMKRLFTKYPTKLEGVFECWRKSGDCATGLRASMK